ncbi:MFS transporter [Bradyrhizobium sp. Arg237L]|uniref:MFS transporter n=1 Tax=Bradyrhizobium sp. Arg237L TaxID=3003352 RepID=UPI00249DF3A5|nr:MFS transporter [Bradyrhizobium sp. Arg237L]MDI4236495.1 MFS transporter [Bradyrhizobium sp. Arg237L]
MTIVSEASFETYEEALERAGTGRFQFRLLAILGLVWAADAMQVLATGFSAPSLAAAFGISIALALQTGAAFFLGMMIGAPFFGALADRFGRRRIFLITVSCDAVFGLLATAAPSFPLLLLGRFLTGFAVGGTLPVDYATMAEFLPSRSRGRWLVALEGFWALGSLAVAVIAWAVHSLSPEHAWRWLLACAALPALSGLWLRRSLPESPLFLLKTGKAEAATHILQGVAVANGKQLDSAMPTLQSSAPQSRRGLLSAELRCKTIFIAIAWLLISVSYYGIFTWLTARLAGEGFGFVRGSDFLVLTALAQLPGYGLAAFGVERWGRRPTLIAFIVLSATGCFAFAVAETPAQIAAAILSMSFALVGAFGALYAFTPEIYPTSDRATGMGAAGAAARVGGFLAPTAIAPIVTKSLSLASAVFAGFLIIAAVAIALIGIETRRQPLQ